MVGSQPAAHICRVVLGALAGARPLARRLCFNRNPLRRQPRPQRPINLYGERDAVSILQRPESVEHFGREPERGLRSFVTHGYIWLYASAGSSSRDHARISAHTIAIRQLLAAR